MIKYGGPAFPVEIGSQSDQHDCSMGMTLRDYFAAAALTSWASSYPTLAIKDIVKQSYETADAMIAEREK